MKRSVAKDIKSIRKKISVEACAISKSVAKSYNGITKDVSKGISNMDLDDRYKNVRKSLRISVRSGNKKLARSLRQIRRSAMFKTIKKGVPVFIAATKVGASVQFRKLKKMTIRKYNRSRKWVLKSVPKVQSWVSTASYNTQEWVSDRYPTARKFVISNYPKMEKFVLTQLPLYRLAFAR